MADNPRPPDARELLQLIDDAYGLFCDGSNRRRRGVSWESAVRKWQDRASKALNGEAR